MLKARTTQENLNEWATGNQTNTATPEAELTAMLAVIAAFNAAERAGISMERATDGSAAYPGFFHEFQHGRYSIEWDSLSCLWTLVSETDDAIDVDCFGERI